jgi:hypothetical protein
LAANGTIVVEDIAAIDGCDHSPWTSRRILGVIDYPDLQVAPAARRGFVPDDAAAAFFRALPELQRSLEEILRKFEEERQRERDAALLKQLKRIFRDFGRRLPHYELFEVERLDRLEEASTGDDPEQLAPDEGGLPPGAALGDEPSLGNAEQAHLFPPGPLASVAIQPRDPFVEVSQRRALRAVPRDTQGRRIEGGVRFTWQITDGQVLASVRPVERDGGEPGCGERVLVEAGELPGTLTVAVTASDGAHSLEASTSVQIVEALQRRGQADLGIPEPLPVYAPGEPWHSRVVDERWEYNSGHPDYLATVDDPRRKLRYVATLLGKEIVLRRYRTDAAGAMLEQMVEVLSWIDKRIAR